MKKWVFIELDDDYPIHLESDTEEEMKEKIWKLLREDGFCDTYIMTKEEVKEESSYEENVVEIE